MFYHDPEDYYEDCSPCPIHPDVLVPWGIDCGDCIQDELNEEMAAEDAYYEYMENRSTLRKLRDETFTWFNMKIRYPLRDWWRWVRYKEPRYPF